MGCWKLPLWFLTWTSKNYAFLWRQTLLRRCKFIHFTFLLKSIPTAFSRMPRDGTQGLSWATPQPWRKPTLHSLSPICSSQAEILFLQRLGLLSYVCVQVDLPPHVPHRVNSHSDPPSAGPAMQPLHNSPLLRGPVLKLCCHADASYALWPVRFACPFPHESEHHRNSEGTLISPPSGTSLFFSPSRFTHKKNQWACTDLN